ncbi:MAG: hypothetical protein ACR2FX_12085 [Chthoniobacterales bacterium]
MAKPDESDHARGALLAGIAAFVTWGLVPVYWKLLREIPAPEILAHRFVWTVLFLGAVLTWQGAGRKSWRMRLPHVRRSSAWAVA